MGRKESNQTNKVWPDIILEILKYVLYVFQKTKQDRRPSQRVPKNRLKKENRQKLKERRSGLFVKEERLAVSATDIGEIEEDIDILG